MGYMGAAWATLICYASMMLLSWIKGREIFPVPYDTKRLLVMMGLAGMSWMLFELLKGWTHFTGMKSWLMAFLLLAVYTGGMWKYIGGMTELPLLKRKSNT